MQLPIGGIHVGLLFVDNVPARSARSHGFPILLVRSFASNSFDSILVWTASSIVNRAYHGKTRLVHSSSVSNIEYVT